MGKWSSNDELQRLHESFRSNMNNWQKDRKLDEGFFDKVKGAVGIGPNASQLVYRFAEKLESVLKSHLGFRAIAAGTKWQRVASRIGEEPPAETGRNGTISSDARSYMNQAAEQFHSNLGEFFTELSALTDSANDLSDAVRDMRSGRMMFDRPLKKILSGLADDIVQHADDSLIYDTIPNLMDILGREEVRATYSPAVWASQNEEKLGANYGQEAPIAAADRKNAAGQADSRKKRRQAARSGTSYMESKD